MATPMASNPHDLTRVAADDGEGGNLGEIEQLHQRLGAAQEALRGVESEWSDISEALGRVGAGWASARAAAKEAGERAASAEGRATRAEARVGELEQEVEALKQQELTDQLQQAEEEERRLAEQLEAIRGRRTEVEERMRFIERPAEGYARRFEAPTQEDEAGSEPKVAEVAESADAKPSGGEPQDAEADTETVPAVETSRVWATPASRKKGGSRTSADEPKDDEPEGDSPDDSYEGAWYKSLRAATEPRRWS